MTMLPYFLNLLKVPLYIDEKKAFWEMQKKQSQPLETAYEMQRAPREI